MTVVELEGVTKVYGDVRALDGVDLAVDRGQVVAVLGPNGAGKTTLFELVLGLVRPSSGQVRVLGGPAGGTARRRTGAMLQTTGLPQQTTVAELVQLIGRSYPAALPVEEVLRRTALGDRAGRTVTALSGGERQRLLLAMAIVSGPDLLVLDEPTAAMDLQSRRGFWDRARESITDGATMVFATHDLSEADAVADRVVVLERGRIIADAPPSELKHMVAGRVVHLRTDASEVELQRLVGRGAVVAVEGGAPPDQPAAVRAWRLHTSKAEDVIVPLVQRGFEVRDLLVDEADLADAFAHLTGLEPSTRPTPAVGASR